MLSWTLNRSVSLNFCMSEVSVCVVVVLPSHSSMCGLLYVAVFITTSVVFLCWTIEGSADGKEFFTAYPQKVLGPYGGIPLNLLCVACAVSNLWLCSELTSQTLAGIKLCVVCNSVPVVIQHHVTQLNHSLDSDGKLACKPYAGCMFSLPPTAAANAMCLWWSCWCDTWLCSVPVCHCVCTKLWLGLCYWWEDVLVVGFSQMLRPCLSMHAVTVFTSLMQLIVTRSCGKTRRWHLHTCLMPNTGISSFDGEVLIIAMCFPDCQSVFKLWHIQSHKWRLTLNNASDYETD